MSSVRATRNALTVAVLLVVLVPTIFIEALGENSTDLEGSTDSTYGTSYEVIAADVTRPITIEPENHVYYPGETVKVQGFVWTEIVERLEALDVVAIEARDGQGNIIAREPATIEGDEGGYTADFALLDGANSGTYTVQARLELEADALGLVEAITSATLQSSAEFVVAGPVEHKVTVENQEFTVHLASNSGINALQFNQQDKKLAFFAEGNDGTTGITEITIPKSLLSGNITVFVDQNLALADDVLLKSDTATETVLEINYHHSIQRIEVAGTNVVPEFSVAIAALAAAVAALTILPRLGRYIATLSGGA